MGNTRTGYDALWMQTQAYGHANKTFLLERGWTKAMISRLLGEPDSRLVQRSGRGRIRRSDRPECIYQMARVIEVEGSQTYRNWHNRLEARRADAADEFSHPKRFPRWGRPINEEWLCGVPEDVREVYSSLAERDQKVIELLFVRGYRQREVASALGMSQQAVSRVRTEFVARINKYYCRRRPIPCE